MEECCTHVNVWNKIDDPPLANFETYLTNPSPQDEYFGTKDDYFTFEGHDDCKTKVPPLYKYLIVDEDESPLTNGITIDETTGITKIPTDPNVGPYESIVIV